MPPAALTSSKRIFTALDDDTPYVAAGPDRSVCIPSTISFLLTPRVACAPTAATMAAPITAVTAPTTSALFIRSPFKASFELVAIHPVDQLLVLDVHEGSPELHGGRQLLVLRRQDLLDQSELLD